jgi:hypothetical protein
LPPGTQLDGLDQIVSDLPSLAGDTDYAEKGRSSVHEMADGMAVIYSRLPGEAWQLGAGYVVARQGFEVGGLRGVLSQADSKDKEAIQTLLLIAVAVGSIGIGLLLSVWEYNGPLNAFRRQVKSLSTAAGARFAAEKLRAPFRQLGLDLNLALDRVARAGGEGAPISIGFEQMFGEAGAQPSMSAFGVPPSVPPASPAGVEAAKPAATSAAFVSAGGGAPPRRPPRNAPQPAAPAVPAEPSPGGVPEALFAAPTGGTVMGIGQFPSIPPVDPGYGLGPGIAQPMAAPADGGQHGHVNGNGHHDEVEPEWTQVYQDFVRIKQDCGEAVEGFTFERFTQTLRKNRDTLMREHGVQQVQFSAYVKQGRAALKAKPVR